jgi:ubiquinone/menaquinone biosynthesis C-methylase UbiE
MSGAYIHGTEPSEQQRLAALNRMTNSEFVKFLNVQPGMRVLEVGSGLGLLAAEVASAAANVQVVGVERASAQISAAVTAPRIRYVHGDAHTLEFEDGTFDLVYCRYVLEHVANPARVVREMRRVTRPGGHVAACENDITLVRVDPPCPAFEEAWRAFQQYQRTLGGESQIGRRLYRLFVEAGLSKVELSVQPEVHWHGSEGFAAWITNLIGNIESARRGLIESTLCTNTQLDNAVAELTRLLQEPTASSVFIWNRAKGVNEI